MLHLEEGRKLVFNFENLNLNIILQLIAHFALDHCLLVEPVFKVLNIVDFEVFWQIFDFLGEGQLLLVFGLFSQSKVLELPKGERRD